ncbi:MAG: radical SAM protein [Salinivirgaceae bacterium]|jgi:nitrogen fixation protein NifB|nr:radical SAM protein [Salinivirgaceae bacterium]
MVNIENHPCFNKEAKGKFGRVHLPVAPKCNIQCNYCNRDYDCVNESRPGVTTRVLQPRQAVDYLKALRVDHPELIVMGIAGPGDPFANPEETMETLRLVREEIPEMILCLSTNGLNLAPYVDEIAELEVSHVTITMNGTDVDMLKDIYRWVRVGKKVYRGAEGSRILLNEQIKCIGLLKEKGITVKINSIAISEINVPLLPELAYEVSTFGADVMNIIPLYPVKDTPYEDFEEPSPALMKDLRKMASNYIKPMEHCARCRADAAGLLGKDIKESTQMLRDFAIKSNNGNEKRNLVAVASHEGLLVNQHLGEAESLYIYKETSSGYRMVEQRKTPIRGTGMDRWKNLLDTIDDCRTLLTSGVGSTPYNFISKSGVEVIEMSGLIDEGLDAIYKGKKIKSIKKRDAFACGSECSGTGGGCG